jgi:hypothetical protein
MKHIRQGPQQHTTSTLDVTKNMTSFAPYADLHAVHFLPINNSLKKGIALRRSIYVSDFEEDFPELSRVVRSGRSTAPGQTLTLDMDQTTLHDNIWPEILDRLDHLRITINRKTTRIQTITDQTLKKFLELNIGVFGHAILTGNQLATTSIHQSHDATGALQKCAVENKVLALSQSQRCLGRRLLQLTIYHFVKLSRAVLALIHQLSNRIALYNPEFEPFYFLVTCWYPVTPPKRCPTNPAIPALPSSFIMPVFPEYY